MKQTESQETQAPKKRKPRIELVFDQDNAWKNYIEKDIFDCIAATHPILYAMIDKLVPPEFLEQEMSNVMRGKYKIQGKEKKTDKLVKLRLLTGEDCIIYVHFEFQDELRDNFPERIYTYRSLIALRYQTQKITTIVIFTGNSPSDKYKIFNDECFGSEIMYKYISYVIADQKIEDLEKSNNPFDLAVLAAKYTLDTEGDAKKRVLFKKKLTELALQKGFSFEKTEQLLSFVLDYMLLSEEMENEFVASSDIYSSLNSEKMVATRGEKMLASTPLGKFLKKAKANEAKILERIAKAEEKFAMIEAEKTKAEAEKTKAEAEKTKAEAEKEAMRQKMVLAFWDLSVSVEKIAEMVEREVEYVEDIIKQSTDKAAEQNTTN